MSSGRRARRFRQPMVATGTKVQRNIHMLSRNPRATEQSGFVQACMISPQVHLLDLAYSYISSSGPSPSRFVCTLCNVVKPSRHQMNRLSREGAEVLACLLEQIRRTSHGSCSIDAVQSQRTNSSVRVVKISTSLRMNRLCPLIDSRLRLLLTMP